MKIAHIDVTLTSSHEGHPLAIIHDTVCGNSSEHEPQHLRAIATMLLRIAHDAEEYHGLVSIHGNAEGSKRKYIYGMSC